MDPSSNRYIEEKGYSSAQPQGVPIQKNQNIPNAYIPNDYGQYNPAPAPQPVVVGYDQPVYSAQIVVNQRVPVGIAVVANTSSPFATVCPFCHNNIMTNSLQTFNCCTCLLCCCTSLIIFLCIQAIRGKDFCCYDAIHSCPRCGKTIATYQSC